MKGILGRKLGMTQVFTIEGTLIPVTVVEVKPNVVLQKKTKETRRQEKKTEVKQKDGTVKVIQKYKREQRSNKPAIGHAKKANTAPKKFIKEFNYDEMLNLEVGSEVKADIFKAGDIVDVQGTSKGHGYNGTIVRNNAHQGPKTHGGSKNIRHQGSLATNGRNNGVVNKGTAMPGQYGGYTTTNQNLEVIKVDAEEGYILVKGNVPGPKRGLVTIHTTVKPKKEVTAVELISYESASVEEELEKVEETINEELATETVAEGK